MEKVFLDITKKCNANCLYCFTNSGVNAKDDTELSDNELINLIDNLVEQKIPKLSLSGGEPFLRNIDKLMYYCNSKIALSITTNGTILTDKILDALKNTNTKLTISLDTLNQSELDQVRKGIDVSTVINNIKKLVQTKEIKEKISIRTTLSSINLNSVIEMIEFCNELGIKKLKFNSTNPFGRASENLYLIPSFSTFQNVYEDIKRYIRNNNIYTNVEIPVINYLTQKERKCLLGNNSMYIDSVGNVYPCAFSEGKLKIGNIHEKSISELIKICKSLSKQNSICEKCLIHRYEN